jgi:hypothetical protein
LTKCAKMPAAGGSFGPACRSTISAFSRENHVAPLRQRLVCFSLSPLETDPLPNCETTSSGCPVLSGRPPCGFAPGKLRTTLQTSCRVLRRPV